LNAIAQAVVEAYRYVQKRSNVNMDETSFAQGNGDGKKTGTLILSRVEKIRSRYLSTSGSSSYCQCPLQP
jgi:hypothetical protein